MQEKPQMDADAQERQEPTPYHNAAYNVFCYRLRKYRENGDVELFNEYQLSKEPLIVDMMVIIKTRDLKIDDPLWAQTFRILNLVEYKSPADKPPTLAVFNKLLGYTYIYAAQEKVKISDMTATLVCARTPKTLFKTLKDDFDYKILQKYDGIYYITKNGADPEKDLVIQVVVQKSDLLLQAMDKKALDADTTDKVAEFMFTAGKDYADMLGYWFKALAPENARNISKRGGDMYPSEKAFLEVIEELGYADRLRQEGQQRGRQEGRQEGARSVFDLLESGCSVAEAKKKLQLV